MHALKLPVWTVSGPRQRLRQQQGGFASDRNCVPFTDIATGRLGGPVLHRWSGRIEADCVNNTLTAASTMAACSCMNSLSRYYAGWPMAMSRLGVRASDTSTVLSGGWVAPPLPYTTANARRNASHEYD